MYNIPEVLQFLLTLTFVSGICLLNVDYFTPHIHDT